MRCEEFEDRLNAVLDERRRPACDAELESHTAACPDCRHLAARYEAMLDGFYLLATPEPPADLALRVLADLQPARTRARQYAMLGAALATAAAVLIVVVPLVRTSSDEQNASAGSRRDAQVVQGAKRTRPAAQIPLVPELLTLAGAGEATDGGDLYAGLAKETGQGLANVILYVPGVGGGRGIIDADAQTDSGGEPAWAVQMSEGLKPITDSVTQTIDLLLRALPGA